jgi:hypothetical protein
LFANEFVIATDAAARDNRCRGTRFEIAHLVAIASLTAADTIRSQDCPSGAGDDSIRRYEAVYAVSEEEGDKPTVDSGAHGCDERFDDSRPCTPGDVEAGHRVAVADGSVSTAFRPADDGEETYSTLFQPGSFFGCRKLEVRLGPPLGPGVFIAVESCGPKPVLSGKLE